jgi:hypothetical protein
MDVRNLGVTFHLASLGRYEAVIRDEERTLAAGLAFTPQEALLAAAQQWAGKP